MPNFFPAIVTIVTDNKFMFDCSIVNNSTLKVYNYKDEFRIKNLFFFKLSNMYIHTKRINLDLLSLGVFGMKVKEDYHYGMQWKRDRYQC